MKKQSPCCVVQKKKKALYFRDEKSSSTTIRNVAGGEILQQQCHFLPVTNYLSKTNGYYAASRVTKHKVAISYEKHKSQ
jgi:hypothetical protein